LSINAMKPFDYHLELGAKLAPLRDSGVAIIGSGNVVHNLGGIDPSRKDSGFDWAHRFDEGARTVMADAPDTLPGMRSAPDFAAAVPTPDHFIPLLYLAGLGAAAGKGADVLVDGYAYGSLSMTAYTLDLSAQVTVPDGPGSGALPAAAPPDGANI
jgi:4,5-DOPA dioxygenase extradiol